MNFPQLKRAAMGFLEDVQAQIGTEKYLAWSQDLGLPTKLNKLDRAQVETVQSLAAELGVSLNDYLPEPPQTPKVNTFGADFHSIYEKHPKTGEVFLITDDRTVETVIKQIQRLDPDLAAQVPWDRYGWDFLISYTPKIQTTEITVERKGKVTIVQREMRGQRSYADYMVNGQVETAGWRTSVPAELVLRQEIADWEIIPYDRSKDVGPANVTTVNSFDKVHVPQTRAEMQAGGWRYTKLENRHDISPYYAEDDTGRVTTKVSAANTESYFGFPNTKKRVKTTHKSGGKSPNPRNLPEHLQTASRMYNLPRVMSGNTKLPAKKFYLYHQDGAIYQKTLRDDPYKVADLKWSEERQALIPIPSHPLHLGDNQRVWDCVLSYLGLRGKKTARTEALERLIRAPLVKYEHVSPGEVNHNRVGGNGTSKRAQREKQRQANRIRHRRNVRIC